MVGKTCNKCEDEGWIRGLVIVARRYANGKKSDFRSVLTNRALSEPGVDRRAPAC